MAFVDIKMAKTSDGYYDLSFEDGDLVTTEGFDTAINMSIMCERRASVSEVPAPAKRRGWWGNAYLGFANFEIGSKLWLLLQARATENTLNNAVTFAKAALQWFVDDEYLDKVNATADYDTEGTLVLLIELIRAQDIVLSNGYRLWGNTIEELREEQ